MAGYANSPFGLREVALYNADGTGKVLLPAALMMHVTPLLTSTRFESEGQIIGASSFIRGAEWELEAGGISLEVLAKLTGQTAAQTGVTPNRVLTLNLMNGNSMPYIRIAGRALGVDSGNVIARFFRCKLEAFEGTFREREFWVTYAKGVAVASASGVFQFVQQETAAVL